MSTSGQPSGVYRISKQNPGIKNYYLIVEPFDKAGQIQPIFIQNEETSKTEYLSKFAVRVSEASYMKIRSEKREDGIVKHRNIATKPAGTLTFTYESWISRPTNGAITKW